MKCTRRSYETLIGMRWLTLESIQLQESVGQSWPGNARRDHRFPPSLATERPVPRSWLYVRERRTCQPLLALGQEDWPRGSGTRLDVRGRRPWTPRRRSRIANDQRSKVV